MQHLDSNQTAEIVRAAFALVALLALIAFMFMPMLTERGTTVRTVRIRYTNHRGETAWRRIVPRTIRFMSSEWHPEAQWMLVALDLDRGEERWFALQDIHAWRPDGCSFSPVPCEAQGGA